MALERIEVRDELRDGESLMSAVAHRAGLQAREFGIFKDAGFRGLYNLSLQQLIRRKGASLPSGRTLYDFMGKTELAANLFRVTQTAERIRHTGANRLPQLSDTARAVGSEVREIMIRSGGGDAREYPARRRSIDREEASEIRREAHEALGRSARIQKEATPKKRVI